MVEEARTRKIDGGYIIGSKFFKPKGVERLIDLWKSSITFIKSWRTTKGSYHLSKLIIIYCLNTILLIH